MFLVFPLLLFLFLDVNKSVYWQFVPVHLNWTFFELVASRFVFSSYLKVRNCNLEMFYAIKYGQHHIRPMIHSGSSIESILNFQLKGLARDQYGLYNSKYQTQNHCFEILRRELCIYMLSYKILNSPSKTNLFKFLSKDFKQFCWDLWSWGCKLNSRPCWKDSEESFSLL